MRLCFFLIQETNDYKMRHFFNEFLTLRQKKIRQKKLCYDFFCFLKKNQLKITTTCVGKPSFRSYISVRQFFECAKNCRWKCTKKFVNKKSAKQKIKNPRTFLAFPGGGAFRRHYMSHLTSVLLRIFKKKRTLFTD